VGIDYLLFFIGSVIIAVIIYLIRAKDRNTVKEIGLEVYPNPEAEVGNLLNLIRNIENGNFQIPQSSVV